MVTPSHCKMKIKRDQPKDQKPGDQPRRKDDVIDGRTTREPVRKDDDIYGLTPRELFSKKHEDLREKGEEWIRKTANSCMLVATLITTMVFAASFTVRGGNGDYEDVISILQTNVAFKVFIVFDVAALVMSTTSALIFLSILTSRYAEKDFFICLPIKLFFGLVTLFLSIACMAVAFSATFFIAYDKTKMTIPWIIAAVIILPPICFVGFHLELARDILHLSCFRFSPRKHKKRLF